MFVIFLSGVILTCCHKEAVPENINAVVKTDRRDSVVGDYEVWDTLFLYHKSSRGYDSFAFEGIFHYPKIELKKEKVAYINFWGNSKFNDGFAYIPITVDKSFISPHGFTSGFFGQQRLFTVNGGHPMTMDDQDETFINLFVNNSEYSATVNADSSISFKSYTLENSKSNAFARRIR